MSMANILVVDDEADIRTLLEEILTDEGYRVATAGNATEAQQHLVSSQPDLVLLDIWMPDTDGITLLGEWSAAGELRCPVVIMSGHGTVETAVEATRLGAVDFVEKPLSIAKLLRTVEKGLESPGFQSVGVSRPRSASGHAPVGKSQKMTDLRQQLEQLAPHAANTLLVGDPGAGRESAARYLHLLSGRGEQPFISLNAGTVTADNAANLLLGAETASGSEPGYLEQANGGTLFVAELQDLCTEGQQLLQGVLDQGGFARLGRTQRLPLRARVMASIQPRAMTDPGRYGLRSDLITTLSASRVRVPPLREHAEDISELLQHMVDHFVDARSLPFRRFSVAAQNRLRHYPWPGNLQELGNLVETLLTNDGPEEIGLAELEEILRPADDADVPLVERDLLAMPLREAREHFERAYLTEQLSLCGGKVGKLAKRVGMERTHLYRKLRALGVDFRQAGGDES